MSLLDLTFSDSLESSSSPSQGTLQASNLQQYASDAAFEAANGAGTDGDIYYNTTTDLIRFYEGAAAAWASLIPDGGTATNNRAYNLSSASTATLTALNRTTGRIYYDTTLAKPIFDDGTSLRQLGGGGGGANIELFLSTVNPPAESYSGGVELLDFDYLSDNAVNLILKVPSNYTAGTQIQLIGGMFATSATTGNVFFKTTTYLIESGSSVLGSLANSHASTNSEVTVSGTTNQITSIGDLDLTSATGTVNAVAVAAGDVLSVEVYRDISAESASAAANARLLRNSFEIEGLG